MADINRDHLGQDRHELADAKDETRNVQQLVKDGAITDDLINATPDFRTLFHADTYQKLLTASGYGEQSRTLSAANRSNENARVQES